jgi:hypothetical protein
MSTPSRETKARDRSPGSAMVAVLTIFRPDWIEALTGEDLDQHAGLVEWLIVVALLSTVRYWRSRRAPNGADRGPRLSS